MKRTIAIKLYLSSDQFQALSLLQEKFSLACNKVSEIALEAKERNRIKLHHLSYYKLRETLPELGSQMTCNAIAKTAQSLKILKHRPERVLF